MTKDPQYIYEQLDALTSSNGRQIVLNIIKKESDKLGEEIMQMIEAGDNDVAYSKHQLMMQKRLGVRSVIDLVHKAHMKAKATTLSKQQ